jgi:hypothetical protein
MALVLETLPRPFRWYEEADFPAKTGNSVLAIIPEWDNVMIVVHKENGAWWMNNGKGKRKSVPTPSVWANIPPAPHEVADIAAIRKFR